MTGFEADNRLVEIKELDEELKRLKLIAIQQIEAIQERLLTKTKNIEFGKQLLTDELRAFFYTVEHNTSKKTQESYHLLSGKLVMKKPTLKLVHDDKELLKYAEKYSELSYIKNTASFDWTSFKNDLDIDGATITNKVTGERLEGIKGLSVKEFGEEFIIRV